MTIKFEIWDTAGQERYRSLASMYYRNAQAALVVYDITHPDSLNKAKYWIRELQKQANSDILIALVGNKKDLEDQRKISNDDVVSLANEFNLLHFQVSAKTGENVNEMFKAIAMKMPYQFQLAKGKNSTNKFADGSNGNPIDLSKRPSTNEQDCAC